jgi:hypothetical protein
VAQVEVVHLESELLSVGVLNAMCLHFSGQQVIIQVWISTHFGVISKRPRDEAFELIRGIFALPWVGVKAHFPGFLSLRTFRSAS